MEMRHGYVTLMAVATYKAGIMPSRHLQKKDLQTLVKTGAGRLTVSVIFPTAIVSCRISLKRRQTFVALPLPDGLGRSIWS